MNASTRKKTRRPTRSAEPPARRPAPSRRPVRRASPPASTDRLATAGRYPNIESIDGRHPLAQIAPSAVVPYAARRRRDSTVAYFNFDLAREIGLIPARHPDELTPELRRTILDSFSLVIVNEWDEAHGHIPPLAIDVRTPTWRRATSNSSIRTNAARIRAMAAVSGTA